MRRERRRRCPVSPGASTFLFATDLDGCLLDATTYSFEGARPALSRLAEKGIPLVLASSKTRAEMLPLARALCLATPLIVENGGALLVPEREFAKAPLGSLLQAGFWALVLGAPRNKILEALDAVAGETGARVRSFSSLGPREVARTSSWRIPSFNNARAPRGRCDLQHPFRAAR